MSDSLRTNSSATLEVDDVKLIKPVAEKVPAPLQVFVDVAADVPLDSLTFLAVAVAEVVADADPSAFAVNPPIAEKLATADADAEPNTIFSHTAVLLDAALIAIGKLAEPNVYDPNVLVP